MAPASFTFSMLSSYKLMLLLSTFLSMQVCKEATRLSDGAQREPDTKKSRALNKRAQQWLDDYVCTALTWLGLCTSMQRHS